MISGASTQAPCCKRTSAAAMEPLTADQCNAVCLLLSVALTSAPCFKDHMTNKISTRHATQTNKNEWRNGEYLKNVVSDINEVVKCGPLKSEVTVNVRSGDRRTVFFHKFFEFLEISVRGSRENVEDCVLLLVGVAVAVAVLVVVSC